MHAAGQKGGSIIWELSTMFRNALKPVGASGAQLFRRGMSVLLRKDDPLLLLPQQLVDCAGQLLADSSNVEPEFLEMGRQLQETHQNVSYMIDHAVNSVATLGGKGNEGILHKIDRIVHDALTALRTCREKVNRDVGHFQAGADLMDDLHGICNQIDGMVLNLKMVGLNIGIESVRSPEANELFGRTASEIRKLTNKITEITESIRDTAAETQGMHRTAHQEISNDIQKMGDVAGNAETAVQEITGEIKELLSLSSDVMNAAGEHSRSITDQIGRVVEIIQFHDRMHQRIAHIREALHETVQAFPSSVSNRVVAAERKKEIWNLHTIVSLQIAQLKQVIDGVSQAHSDSLKAFDDILVHVEKMGRKLASINSEPDGYTDANSLDSHRHPLEQAMAVPVDRAANTEQLFLKLRDTVNRFEKLLSQGEQVHERMDQIFDRASRSADTLTVSADSVQDINFEIHLLSLNAAIKSAHIGSEGRALEVLAHAVKGLSDQSNGFVARINGLVEKIIAASRIGTDSKSETEEYNACRRQVAFDSDGGIMEHYQTLNAVSTDAASRAESIIDAITTARKKLSFLSDLKERFLTHLHTLESCESLLHPLVDDMSFTSEEEEIEGLKARYTMEEERLVHTQKSDYGKTVFAVASTPETNGPGDDIELFDDDFNARDDGGIELFDDDVTSRDDAEARIAEDELGENIELF